MVPEPRVPLMGGSSQWCTFQLATSATRPGAAVAQLALQAVDAAARAGTGRRRAAARGRPRRAARSSPLRVQGQIARAAPGMRHRLASASLAPAARTGGSAPTRGRPRPSRIVWRSSRIWSRSSAAFSNSRFWAAAFICFSSSLISRCASSLGMRGADRVLGPPLGGHAHALGQVADLLDDARRGDAVLACCRPPGSARRRLVSSMACRIESVILSAYMITRAVDVARGAADGLDQRAGRSAGSLPCRRPGWPPATPRAGPAPRAAG